MDKIIRFVTTIFVIAFIGLLGSSAVFADEYEFLIKVPDIGEISFSSCTGMGSESEVIELTTTGSKRPNIVSSTNVVCKRPILPKSEVWEWHKHVFFKETGGTAYNQKDKFSKNILIVAIGPNKQEIAWWQLLEAWPSKVVDLYDGKSFIEEVVLVSKSTQRLSSPNKWDLYKHSISGPNTVKPPKVEMSTGHVVAPGTKAQGGQHFDLSGTWNSNIGLVYQISQSGNKLSYQDPYMHKPVNGTVDGKTVTISWMEGNAAKNLKGTITSVGNDGKAKRIEWQNSVIFNR